MKILITGASGFIGRNLTKCFARDNCQVIAQYRQNLPMIPDGLAQNIRWHQADLGRDNSLANLESVDVVIHAASHTHLLLNSTARDYVHGNVNATLELAKYLDRIKPQLVFYLSTFSAYGNIDVREVTETTPLNQPALYGATKYLGELIMRENAAKIPAVCLRLPGVVGPDYFAPWLGRLLKKAMSGEPLTIFNPDAHFNNVVDIRYLVDFLNHVIRKGTDGFDVVNLAASVPVRISQVADLVVRLTGGRSQVVVGGSAQHSFFINIDRIRDYYGFEPPATTDVVLRYVLENSLPAPSGEG